MLAPHHGTVPVLTLGPKKSQYSHGANSTPCQYWAKNGNYCKHWVVQNLRCWHWAPGAITGRPVPALVK